MTAATAACAGKAAEARHGRAEQVSEHRVRGREEPAEQEQNGQAERCAAGDRSGAGAAELCRRPLPGHLSREQVGAARERPGARRGEPRGVLGDRCLRRPRLCAPERPEADGAREREDVRRGEERRVVPGERACEEQQRQSHPASALVERRVRDAQQQGQRADEEGSEEEDVQTGRPAVEEHVPERAQCDGDAEQRDPEAAFPTHPVGNADSRV